MGLTNIGETYLIYMRYVSLYLRGTKKFVILRNISKPNWNGSCDYADS